jgi:hypothetical protein
MRRMRIPRRPREGRGGPVMSPHDAEHECSYLPWEYSCIHGQHSASRRCRVCGEHEYEEDRSRVSDCETCSLVYLSAKMAGRRLD